MPCTCMAMRFGAVRAPWLSLQPGASPERSSRHAVFAGNRSRVRGRAVLAIGPPMQVENTIAFAAEQEPSGLEIRINFGVFAGRDATTAEIEELGRLLLPEAGEVS